VGDGPALVEGHGGIFEVSVNGEILFTNRDAPGGIPRASDVVTALCAHQAGAPIESVALGPHQAVTPCCGEPCAGTEPAASSTEVAARGGTRPRIDRITVDFLYLDLSTCPRCQGTDQNLEIALAALRPVVDALGVTLEVRKVHVESLEQARAVGLVSSPTIRVNGRDIAVQLVESNCDACGAACGEPIDCRLWLQDGQQQVSAPVEVIIDAVVGEIYAPHRTPDNTSVASAIPENLRRFFTGTTAR
jgi:hypothetical protein